MKTLGRLNKEELLKNLVDLYVRKTTKSLERSYKSKSLAFSALQVFSNVTFIFKEMHEKLIVECIGAWFM